MVSKDHLVADNCHYLDGKCDCKSINECQYIKSKDYPLTAAQIIRDQQKDIKNE